MPSPVTLLASRMATAHPDEASSTSCRLASVDSSTCGRVPGPSRLAIKAHRLMVMNVERIVADPAVMAGAPTVRGTRITVSAVLGQLGAGLTVEEVLSDYPTLTKEDVYAALRFAAQSIAVERPFVAA